MQYTYETIKELARKMGVPVTELIALAPANDPYYTGMPNQVILGEWFAEFYDRNYPNGGRIHVRRCHYQIMSLSMFLPNGKPYENTEECWNTLLLATKAARYLNLVDVSVFDDRKNDAPLRYDGQSVSQFEVGVHAPLYLSNVELPRFPDLPSYLINTYQAAQDYHLEVWCEKTTMNDILLPLCEHYGMTLQTGAGELSITATNALVERIKESGQKTRIFYISDYDPAGQSMPVAIARKLQYFVDHDHIDADIRLFPVVLTATQVQRYQLPRTPIKESERRKDAFEARHGSGATELDALEALHSGELEQILRGYIEGYYDTTLASQEAATKTQIEEDLQAIKDEVLSDFTEQITNLRRERAALFAPLEQPMQAYAERVKALWWEMQKALQERVDTLEEPEYPQARPAREIGEGLYDSQRTYLEQNEEYKRFQGKPSPLRAMAR